MLGVIANVATVIVGSILGLIFRKGIPDNVAAALMKCLGFCTVYMGVTGMSQDNTHTLIIILSMVLGTLIGILINIDKWLNVGAEFIGSKFKSKANGGHSIAEGFVSASLLFCVGAMTVVGSLQAGLKGDNSTLFTKAVLDFISSMIFASTLGFGVILSVGTVIVIQGGIVLLAQFLAPLLSDAVIDNMVACGSIMIFALGLNLIGLTKTKIANMLPAIFMPIAFCPLFDLISSLL